MKIVSYKIDDLIEAEYNPRQLTKSQYTHIADSIKRFGIVDPIIINTHKDRKNIIVGGHQRVKVAKDLNIKIVPCVQVKLNLEKEKELNIRLNKNTGEWNYDLLADLFEIEDLTDWGFQENSLIGFKEIDYSVLDDIALDKDIEELKDLSTKAIQIEFKLEDYEEAYKMFQEMRKKEIYIGGEIMKFLQKK